RRGRVGWHPARLRARRRRDHDRADGLGQRRDDLGQRAGLGAHVVGEHRRRAGRGGGGQPALQHALLPRGDPLPDHLHHQRGRRPVRGSPAPASGGRMSATTLAPALRPLVKERPRDLAGPGFTALTGIAAALIVLMVAIIISNVAWFGTRTLTWEFLSGVPKHGMTAGGIFPAIFGTAALVILMVIALVPFGVGAAVYLHEYARPDAWFTRAVRFSVNNLAGVPSIVFGLFGLGFFIQYVGRQIDRAAGIDVVWG